MYKLTAAEGVVACLKYSCCVFWNSSLPPAIATARASAMRPAFRHRSTTTSNCPVRVQNNNHNKN